MMKDQKTDNRAANTGTSAISDVRVTLFVKGPTNNVSAQSALLDAIAHEPQTAPTHGSLDERTRKPFSVAALATEAGTKMSDPVLWRLTPPKHWGVVNSTPLMIARISLEYEAIAQEHVAPACDGIARLVDKLQPAYAALHFWWTESTDEHTASMRGFSTKALHYCKFGPPGVFAWTWFGPALVELFGMKALLEQGATPTPWGGASLPLVERPWAVAFEELRARQIAVDKALRAQGIFGDYSRPVPAKGPRWSSLIEPPKANV